MRSTPALLLLVLAGCATAPPAIPPQLQPAPGQAPTLTLAARGVQVYECRGSAWTFVAPEAELYDGTGRKVGSHGAGPSWLGDDGSRVTGKLRERVDAPDAGAVPWLLLDAATSGDPGLFSGVVAVQRVRTSGGVAPAGGCGSANAGATARVFYTADYRFFGAR